MANTIASQVQALYVGYLGRAADQAGLDFWTNAITAGTSTIESVALGFVESAEYTALYAGKTNEELAAAIYENVLGRAADADGLAFWVGELTKGVQTPETLLAAMLNSLGTVDQQVIDNKVFVANAYTAAAGPDYDAAAGAKILEGVDGTAASVSAALATVPAINSATLTSTLVSLQAANEAVDANVEAWGKANDNATPSEADIYAALEAAEAALATAASDVNLGITAHGDLNAAEAGAYDTYNSEDDAEALALSIAQSQIATKKLALDGAVSAQVAALEAVSTTDKTGSLKTLVDTYLSQVETVTAAEKAKDLTVNTLNAKLAAANIALNVAFDTSSNDYSFVVSTAANVVTFTSAYGVYAATYNATTNAWAYSLAGTPLTATAAAADTKLQALLANADAKAALDAFAADAEAGAAITAAQNAAVATLVKIEAVDAGLVDETGGLENASIDYGDALAGAAASYKSAVEALADHVAAKAEFDAAISDVEAARADAAALASLEKTAADLLAKVTAEYTVGVIGTNDATAADDLFIFDGETGDADLADFGAAGNDQIYFGTGYTLVTLAEGKVITDNVGSSSALEIFYDAANAALYVETETFGGNSAGTSDLVTIVLTGVTDGVELSSSGFLTVA